MNLQQRKYQFLQEYMEVIDTATLDKLEQVLHEENSKEPELQLTEQFKKEIDKALNSLSEGKGLPHEKVMQEMVKKYPNLKFKK